MFCIRCHLPYMAFWPWNERKKCLSRDAIETRTCLKFFRFFSLEYLWDIGRRWPSQRACSWMPLTCPHHNRYAQLQLIIITSMFDIIAISIAWGHRSPKAAIIQDSSRSLIADSYLTTNYHYFMTLLMHAEFIANVHSARLHSLYAICSQLEPWFSVCLWSRNSIAVAACI